MFEEVIHGSFALKILSSLIFVNLHVLCILIMWNIKLDGLFALLS